MIEDGATNKALKGIQTEKEKSQKQLLQRNKQDSESSFEIEHNGMSEEDNLRFSKRPKITVLSDLSRGAVEKFMYAYKLYCRIS